MQGGEELSFYLLWQTIMLKPVQDFAILKIYCGPFLINNKEQPQENLSFKIARSLKNMLLLRTLYPPYSSLFYAQILSLCYQSPSQNNKQEFWREKIKN